MAGSGTRKFTNLKQKQGRYGKNKRFSNAAGDWDSKDEYKRWLFLEDMQKRGVITDLEKKVVFSFDINGVHICKFSPDFRYRVGKTVVVEDFKGNVVTRDFKLRCKMLKAFMGIDCVIVTNVTDVTPISNAQGNG